MDVIIPTIKITVALGILAIIARFPEKRPDSSPFFAGHKWTLWDAYKIVAALTVALVLDIVLFLWWPSSTPAFLSIVLPCSAVVFGCGAAIERRHRVRWVDLGIDKTCFFGSGLIALNVALGHFALLVAGGGIAPFNRFIIHDVSIFAFWVDAASAGLWLAWAEETLFRRILYAPVARRVGKWGAIVALSLVECLMHDKVDVLQSCLLFLVFVVFFCVYIRTESLMAPMILHVGMNVPAWQPGSMPVIAPYVHMSTVELLYICAPLWALMTINTWRLVNFPSPLKHPLVENNDTGFRKE